MKNQSVASLVAELGTDVISDHVGVSSHAVRKAVQNKAFPASWYSAMRALCDMHNAECPEHLFAFKYGPASGFDAVQRGAA